jgi:hypothetical protein
MAQATKNPPQSPPGSGSRFAKPETPRQHEENLLDEAIEDSFPASDPPAMTNPSRKVKTPAPAADPVRKAAKKDSGPNEGGAGGQGGTGA